MKKNVLALSITAALVGLTGSAHAMTGTLGGATVGSTLALNGDGVGQILFVPYFTAQDSNSTLINLVNTDTTNGKAVKVRFRGAANSDDIYDFQVFLSPGDVWTANVGRAADGRAQLTTSDNTCTKPAKATLNTTPFVTARLDTTLTAAQQANGTREGYIEIFNMADVPPLNAGAAAVFDVAGATTAGVAAAPATANPLFTAIKHVSSVAPCSGTAWTNLDTTNLIYSTAAGVPSATSAAASSPRTFGLLPPTTGLLANWTIINTVGAAAWSGEAFAVQTTVAADAGNVVYWPQTGTSVGAANINAYTADPLLRNPIAAGVGAIYTNGAAAAAPTLIAAGVPAVTAGFYDLPDMSTPYVATSANPMAAAMSLTQALGATAATNEFLTTSGISASTDWVFSMPTRRYHTAFNYGFTSGATNDGRMFTDMNGNALTTGYFLPANTLVSSSTNGNGRQICVTGLTQSVWDREENTLTASTAVVVSPSVPGAPLSFCGEAQVLSVNNGGILTAGTGALKASVAVKDLDVTYREGWMTLTTPSATALPNGVGSRTALPVVGSSFARAFAGTNSFGAAWKHRFAR